MQYVEVWVYQINAPGHGLDETPRRVKAWLPRRLALRGNYQLVEGE